MGQRLHITPEALRRAYEQHHTPDWPDTYDACMAHPLYSRLVRTLALGHAQAQRRQAGQCWPTPPRAGRPARCSVPAPARQGALAFDAKRAAAHDLPPPPDTPEQE